MGRIFEQLDDTLMAWIGKQPMFFVASAPNDADGHVNLSPKGDMDTFRILGPTTFAYLDLPRQWRGDHRPPAGERQDRGDVLRVRWRAEGAAIAWQGSGRAGARPGVRRPGGGLRAIRCPAGHPAFGDRGGDHADLRFLRVCGAEDGAGRRAGAVGALGEHQEAANGDGWKEKYFFANNQESIDGLAGLDFPDGDPVLTDREQKKLTSAGKAL
ncbi:MAG: hypothetical protein QM753_17870 [Thermomicrobiales bacterium]